MQLIGEDWQDISNLCADAVGVVHPSEHLAKVVRVDLARGASEVLDAVRGGPDKTNYRKIRP